MEMPFAESSVDNPDFGYGRSVYKVMPDKVTMEEAELICGRTLPRGGKLLEVYSQDELDEIDFELIIRHRGYDFQYWLFGSLDEAFLYHKIERMPNPGRSPAVTRALSNMKGPGRS